LEQDRERREKREWGGGIERLYISRGKIEKCSAFESPQAVPARPSGRAAFEGG
jgi:hypothetical protein